MHLYIRARRTVELRFAPRGVTVVRVTTSLSRAIIPGIRILVKGPTSGTVRNRPVTMRYRFLSIVIQSPFPKSSNFVFFILPFLRLKDQFRSLSLSFFFLRQKIAISNFTSNRREFKRIKFLSIKAPIPIVLNRVNCHYLLLFIIVDTYTVCNNV